MNSSDETIKKLCQLLDSEDEKNVQVGLTMMKGMELDEVLKEKVNQIYAHVFEDNYYYQDKHYSKNFDKFFIKHFSKYDLSKMAIEYSFRELTEEIPECLNLQGFRYLKTLQPLLDNYCLGNVSTIIFSKGSVPDIDLLKKLPVLKKLGFSWKGKPKKMEHLAELPQLESLSLELDHHKLAGVELKQLKELLLYTASVSKAKEGLAFLNCCKTTLEHLRIGHVHYYNQIDDTMVFPVMPQLKKLEMVSRLRFSSVIFQNLSALEEMDITGKIHFEFLPEGLEKLPNLRKLQIRGMNVNEYNLKEFVTRLPNLERLIVRSDEYIVESQQLIKTENNGNN